jgi:DNA sulfur modification protein DndD
MLLRRLEMRNFMPFGGDHEVLFPSEGQRNVMLVWGHNEHGKTSLLNALRWALFGYALGRHRKSHRIHEIVNADAREAGDWSVAVRLVFASGGDEFDLLRSASVKPLVGRPGRDSDFDVRLEMKVNGQPLGAREIQVRLNRIMPEPVSRFHLFDGELLQEYEDLLSESSTEIREIRSAIEQVLGIPSLVQGRDELQALTAEARKAQARASRSDDALRATADRLIDVQAEIEAISKDRTALEDQLHTLGEEIEADREFLDSQRRALELRAEAKALRADVDECEAALVRLRLEKADALSDAWKDLLAAKVQERVASLRDQVSGRDERLLLIGETAFRAKVLTAREQGSACEVCGAEDGPGEGDALRKALDDVTARLSKLQAQADADDDVMPRLAALGSIGPNGAVRRLHEIESHAAQAMVRQTKAESALKDLLAEIKGDDSVEAERVRVRVDQKLKLVGRLEQQIREADAALKALLGKEGELSKLLARSNASTARRANREAEVLASLTEVFGDGVDELRERLLERIEATASETFLKLTAEPAYRGLTINKNYGLSIVDNQDRTVSLRSSGAEQIVALSLIQALNQTANAAGPLVVDTPFGRLDPRHRENILRAIPDFGVQVVLLAHEGELPRETAIDCLGSRISMEYTLERLTPSQSRLLPREYR